MLVIHLSSDIRCAASTGFMPRSNLHDDVLRAYFLHLTLRDTLLPSHDLAPEDLLLRLQADLDMYHEIKNTCYLNPWTSVPKSGSLHLLWRHQRISEVPRTDEGLAQTPSL